MMWLSFFIACALALVAMYIPGSMLLKAVGLPGPAAIGFAPSVSIAAYAILVVLYSHLGVLSSWWTLLVPVFCLGIVVWVISLMIGKNSDCKAKHEPSPWLTNVFNLLMFVVVGLSVVTVFFVRNLDGPASFFQAFDNGTHLNTVRTFAETGVYSSTSTSVYASASESPFLEMNSFYPAAWHCLCAMIVDALDCGVTVAVNAVNTMCASVVFPASMAQLIWSIWGQDKKKLLLGAVCSSAFVAFPFGFLTFGPLYSNLLSMSMLPCMIAAFINLTSLQSGAATRLRSLGIFLVALVSAALAQPNSIFSAAVVLAPYCVFQAMRVTEYLLGGRASKTRRFIAGALAALLVVSVWTVCYFLPPLNFVVSFNWAKRLSVFQATVNALLLAFVERPVQLTLAILVIAGLLKLLLDKKRRWLVGSFLFACFIFILAVSTEGTLKHYFAGFWYTDPFRLAATTAVAAIPLAVAGAEALWHALTRLSEMLWSTPASKLVARFSYLLLIVSVFLPSFTMEGMGEVTTAFGKVGSLVSEQNSTSSDANVLTGDERQFAEEALQLVPKGARIINEPNDGSAFLYALYDANIIYRNFALPSIENEKSESVVVRRSLDKIASDSTVRDAVDKLGADYILLLDLGGEREGRAWFWSYYEDQWEGLNAIDDETPGLEIVLARDDMRLYRIVR